MKELFNVIIPVAYKDYTFLPRTIKYLEENISPKKIYVLADTKLRAFLPNSIKKNKIIHIIDENSVINGLSYASVKQYLMKHDAQTNRTGWFLQQFLKMGFANSSLCDTEYYLSWDADTIPLKRLHFMGGGKPFFTIKRERNQPYFDTLSKLFRFPEEAPYSFIAEHMLFNKTIMQELLSNIESNNALPGENWIEKIIFATNPNEINSFSEFETYGNYCYNNYSNLYATQTLNTFRKAGYINGRFISDRKLHYMAFDLDIASFELGDYPSGLGKYICYAYTKWLVIKEYIIKQFYIRNDDKKNKKRRI